MTLLLLAGTAEARDLARRLAEAGIDARASLSGATRDPAPLALPTRVGGFGGAGGFRDHLWRRRVDRVIDATHPFAVRVTARTHAICAEAGVPLLRLERPGWEPGPGDRWTEAEDEAEAARLVPPGAVAFLATGRRSLPVLSLLRAAHAYLRVIDAPSEPFPLPGGYVEARPPFDVASEVALFARLGVTHLLARDAGGAEGRAKLDAARALGIAVLLVRRPGPPSGLRTVATVEAAMDWVGR